ncbi:MAG: KTSC domain-containing protein [Pseudomonadota bacterium]
MTNLVSVLLIIGAAGAGVAAGVWVKQHRLISRFRGLARYPAVSPAGKSSIDSLLYSDGRLAIRFITGETWIYSGIPHAVYKALLRSPHPATFYNGNILDKYPRIYGLVSITEEWRFKDVVISCIPAPTGYRK